MCELCWSDRSCLCVYIGCVANLPKRNAEVLAWLWLSLLVGMCVSVSVLCVGLGVRVYRVYGHVTVLSVLFHNNELRI